MDEAEGETPLIPTDPEVRELLGLFEVPAFARRGHDLEYALKRLRERLQRERLSMLDMVRLRLKQWSTVATGPHDFAPFRFPVEHYFRELNEELPNWARSPASPRARRTIAQDLIASVERFNRRWTKSLRDLNLGAVNSQIERYNRYYLLEKECSLGSSRLAARFFVPQDRLSVESLLREFPLLPTASLVD